jgi:hypothetical protein
MKNIIDQVSKIIWHTHLVNDPGAMVMGAHTVLRDKTSKKIPVVIYRPAVSTVEQQLVSANIRMFVPTTTPPTIQKPSIKGIVTKLRTFKTGGVRRRSRGASM